MITLGFCYITAELFGTVKAYALGPRKTTPWPPRGPRAPVQKSWIRSLWKYWWQWI